MIRPGKRSDDRLPSDCKQTPVALTDVDTLSEIVAESSAVIYCAGSVRGSNYTDFEQANILGIKAMLRALESVRKPPPMLLVSSLAASRPELSDYSRSKREGEDLLTENSVLPWTVLRPPAIYGPGDKEMLPVLKMARQGVLAHTGPADQRLSMLHVDDLTTAIVAWVEGWQNCLQQTYAIDDGKAGGYSWVDIGNAVSHKKFRLIKIPRFLLESAARLNLISANIFRYSPMLTPGKARELIQAEWLCADNERYNAATAWQPRFDLSRGVEMMLEQGLL